MGFLKKLADLLTPPTNPADYSYWVTVKCNRCGETIRARVDMRNDLSLNDDSSAYFCRKTLVGNNLCFQPIEVELTFDTKRNLLDRQVTGGTFVEDTE